MLEILAYVFAGLLLITGIAAVLVLCGVIWFGFFYAIRAFLRGEHPFD